jgi:hypothetical protein
MALPRDRILRRLSRIILWGGICLGNLPESAPNTPQTGVNPRSSEKGSRETPVEAANKMRFDNE